MWDFSLFTIWRHTIARDCWHSSTPTLATHVQMNKNSSISFDPHHADCPSLWMRRECLKCELGKWRGLFIDADVNKIYIKNVTPVILGWPLPVVLRNVTSFMNSPKYSHPEILLLKTKETQQDLWLVYTHRQKLNKSIQFYEQKFIIHRYAAGNIVKISIELFHLTDRFLTAN